VVEVDPFHRCPECGAGRQPPSGAVTHAPTCPRAFGRSTGRGLDAAALEALGARLTPTTRLYAMLRNLARTKTTATIGFAIVRNGAAERIAREIGAALGLEYHAGEDGLILRVAALPALVARLARALYGPDARPFPWQWL
jgi:hypothetical protein